MFAHALCMRVLDFCPHTTVHHRREIQTCEAMIMSKRFGTIPQAVDYSARSRSRLYQLAAKHEGLFRKDGKSTIVDFAILDRILDSLPVARIKDAGIEAT
jgi:hypothetical protein